MLKVSSTTKQRIIGLILLLFFWLLAFWFHGWSITLIYLVVGLVLGWMFFFFLNFQSPEHWLIDPALIDKVTHSLIFLLLLIPFSFLVVTSTGSWLGIGLIISLNTNLSLDLFDLRHNKQALINRFFGQLKRLPTDNEIRFLLVFWLVWTCLLWLMVLFS